MSQARRECLLVMYTRLLAVSGKHLTFFFSAAGLWQKEPFSLESELGLFLLTVFCESFGFFWTTTQSSTDRSKYTTLLLPPSWLLSQTFLSNVSRTAVYFFTIIRWPRQQGWTSGHLSCSPCETQLQSQEVLHWCTCVEDAMLITTSTAASASVSCRCPVALLMVSQPKRGWKLRGKELYTTQWTDVSLIEYFPSLHTTPLLQQTPACLGLPPVLINPSASFLVTVWSRTQPISS